MSVAEVEAKIRAAVAEAKAEGWRIRPGSYFFEPLDKNAERHCCPIFACVRGGSLTRADVEIRRDAAKCLDIGIDDALSVVFGFDGADHTAYMGRTKEFVALGVRLQDLVDP